MTTTKPSPSNSVRTTVAVGMMGVKPAKTRNVAKARTKAAPTTIIPKRPVGRLSSRSVDPRALIVVVPVKSVNRKPAKPFAQSRICNGGVFSVSVAKSQRCCSTATLQLASRETTHELASRETTHVCKRKRALFWGQNAFRAKMRAKTASRKELGDPGRSARKFARANDFSGLAPPCATFCGRNPKPPAILGARRRDSGRRWSPTVALSTSLVLGYPPTEYQPAVDQLRSFGRVDYVLLGEFGFSAARLVQ